MLDAGIIWNVIADPNLLTILAVTLVVAWPLGRLLRPGGLGIAFVLVLGAIVAATTTTSAAYYSFGGVGTYLHWWADPSVALDGFGGTREKIANVLLFLPLGLVGTLLWRRPLTVFAGCAGLSFLIEAWQGFIGRGGDPADVVHNAAGALIGVVAARLWTYLASQGTV